MITLPVSLFAIVTVIVVFLPTTTLSGAATTVMSDAFLTMLNVFEVAFAKYLSFSATLADTMYSPAGNLLVSIMIFPFVSIKYDLPLIVTLTAVLFSIVILNMSPT